MIEPLDDMPEGTIGFKVGGEVTRADYTDVLVPALKGVVDGGGKLKQLYLIEDLEEMDAGALWEDAKTGIDLEAFHRAAFERAAVVTDQQWLVRAIGLFGWMAPGEMKLFPVAQTDEAKAWVAA